jgi:hypothetical protein
MLLQDLLTLPQIVKEVIACARTSKLQFALTGGGVA